VFIDIAWGDINEFEEFAYQQKSLKRKNASFIHFKLENAHL
jgi:hypothetical protein